MRLAGVPLDVLDALHTPRTLEAARSSTRARAALADAVRALVAALRASGTDGARRAHVAWLAMRGKPLDGVPAIDSVQARADAYHRALAELRRCEAEEAAALDADQRAMHGRLRDAAAHLVGFAPFAAPGLLEAVEAVGAPRADGRRPPRTACRTVAQYLQRVAAKNDSVSAYGPTSWGVVDPARRGLAIDPVPGIQRRTVFYERWLLERLTAAMNRDDEARLETAPRVHGGVRLEDSLAIVLETGAREPLSELDREVLARCDGATAAHALTAAQLEALSSLVRRGLAVWRIEAPALDAHGFDVLARAVAGWRDGPARRRWSDVLEPLARLKARFGEAGGDRHAVIEQAAEVVRTAGGLQGAGGVPIDLPQASRTLYAASNLFGEQCVRQTGAVLGGDIVAQLTEDAAPWYDLWQDIHAHVSGRVAARLLEVVDLSRPVPLPAYLARLREAGLDLRRDALPRLAAEAFAEVQGAWVSHLAQSAPDARRRTLTADELGFVRRTFPAARLPDFACPSIDVQLVAASADRAAPGDFEVLLAELHGGIALLTHGLVWSCPDPAALGASLFRASGGVPVAYYGQAGAFLSCHTAIQFASVMPRQFVCVADARTDPSWRKVPPAQVEVHRSEGPDIRLRSLGGEDLGTITRTWATSMGTHPFSFTWKPHSPRLHVGRVIVQRETWTVTGAELPAGGSPIARTDALRAATGMPRFVFLRPTPAALPRSGNLGRDKDVKPSLVDLESALGIEIFVQRLRKYGELEIAEMLPPPDRSPWIEADGRRSFELRMMIEPGA
ncbi:MAG TPA: hypothetical protein VK932_05855 [Kofleriaceae bacterium]|nr:hypothetical protein [Kofleriaceae bacterium]